MIFVFGSNLAGRHGKGAARDALLKYGAVYGQGEGIQGNSYAIPTKDEVLAPLSLTEIRENINRFIFYASQHPDKLFVITKVGCGLAGYSPRDIGPLFVGAPSNCYFQRNWVP